jgi:hypothetical protein
MFQRRTGCRCPSDPVQLTRPVVALSATGIFLRLLRDLISLASTAANSGLSIPKTRRNFQAWRVTLKIVNDA